METEIAISIISGGLLLIIWSWSMMIEFNKKIERNEVF